MTNTGRSALVDISRRLAKAVDGLAFSEPVAYVYNPLRYARVPHELYLERFGAGPKEVLLLGMNPGPFGMAQTGVPFGEVNAVRGWLGLEAKVSRPAAEHPKRPIEGFACQRAEVSGARLWGWARDRFETPEHFFSRFFVVNYCPLVFMDAGGRNLTPDKFPKAESSPLFTACDDALRRTVAFLQPKLVVGVGAFASKRAEASLAAFAAENQIRFGTIPHPSPASPLANRGWAPLVDTALLKLGITP
jgi:single-strand selective monofunctional uracil DNA glycosylase